MARTLFGSAVFLLMGGNLILGARSHARAATRWAEELPPVETRQRQLLWAYRAGGAVFAALALWMLWCLARDPARLSILLPSRKPSPAARALGGLFFLCCGSILAALGVTRIKGPEEKAGLWTGRLMALAFLLFGAYLIRRAAS